MIGRADIEGSKSDVAMNAWPPQASYPCGTLIRRVLSERLLAQAAIGPATEDHHSPLRFGAPPTPLPETPLSGWADYILDARPGRGNGRADLTPASV